MMCSCSVVRRSVQPASIQHCSDRCALSPGFVLRSAARGALSTCTHCCLFSRDYIITSNVFCQNETLRCACMYVYEWAQNGILQIHVRVRTLMANWDCRTIS